MSVSRGMVFLIVPLYALELGARAGGAGTIFALIGLGVLISDVPTGFTLKRFGERRLMLIGLVFIGVAGIGASLSPSLFLLGLSTFVYGVGTGVWFLSRINYLTENVVIDHRGRAMAMMGGTERIGMFAGPAVGGVISKYLGFQTTFLISALIIALVVVFILVVLPADKKRFAIAQPQRILSLIPNMLVQYRQIFLTAGVVSITLQMIRAGRQLLVPLWGEHIGLDAAEIGFIYGLSFAVDMSLFYLAGTIMDRFGRKWAAGPCLLILSSSLILLPFSQDFISFLMIAILSGLGNGCGAGIIMTLGADLSPLKNRSEFLGVWRMMGDTGGTIGPLIIGGISKLFLLSIASIVTGGIGLIGACILIFFVRETAIKTHKVLTSEKDRS